MTHRRIAAVAWMAVLGLSVATAGAAPVEIQLRTGPGGQPMIHAFLRGPAVSVDCDGVAVRFSTGSLISTADNSSWYPLNTHDPSLAFERGTGSPDTRTGRGLGANNASCTAYDGAVSGGVNPISLNTSGVITYNPMTDTIVTGDTGGQMDMREVVFQTAAEGIGVWKEGSDTGAGRVDTLGYISETTAPATGDHAYGREWVQRKALDDGDGSRTVDRYFVAKRSSGSTRDLSTTEIRVLHVDVAYSTTPTTTAHGARNAADYRGKTVSKAKLLDSTALAALVPDDFDDQARGWAVLDETIYVVFQNAALDKVYLAAADYTIPDDPDLAITTTQVDINSADPTKDYLDLSAMFPAGITRAQDIAFSHRNFADGGGLVTMYLALGYGAEDNIYVFDVTPEPATAGLLGLGFAGLALIRRRRSR